MATPRQAPRDPWAELATKRKPRRKLRLSTIAKAATAVVGFASAVTGLLFAFLPQLQPDEPAPPPAEQSATLSGLVLDPDTTRRQYLDRTDQPRLGFTNEQLAKRGAFVRFRVEIVGYRGKTVPLQSELVDGRTGDELGQIRAVTIKPPADRVSSPWHDWVALRSGTGRYVIVVKLLDERSVRAIACIQSEPFGGLAGLAPGKRLGLCESA